MPGGEDYRRWYAMRQRLQKEGKWTHRVPAQEEGEPAAKQQKKWWEHPHNQLDLGPPLEKSPEPQSDAAGTSSGTVGTPESLPGLEDSPTAEGESCLVSAS